MHLFQYRKGELYCEDVPVKVIAQQVGTPLYLYSYHTLSRHFQVFDQALRDLPHLICYSAKANANLAILKTFISLGGGVDVVSGGRYIVPSRREPIPRRSSFQGWARPRRRSATA